MAGTAVLVGALTVGDSVRFSLMRIAADRLGTTELALTSGDRFFRVRLADSLSISLGITVAPLLQTKGIAIAEGGSRRLNAIQVVGVDARFGKIGGAGPLYDRLGSDEAVVNRPLAERLGIRENDEILVRMEKPEAMPKDAPLSSDARSTLARRYKIIGIALDSSFGKFNLRPDQVTPATVFLSLPALARELGFEERANILLFSGKTGFRTDFETVRRALKEAWTPADAGLEVREIQGGAAAELRSQRVFLDPPVVEAALSLSLAARPVLTYFVNELRRGDAMTPYSFVSAPGGPIVPPDMDDQEIILNDWLASDLRARVGDRIRLTYFVLGPRRALEEKSSDFRVRAIVPLKGIYADRELLPDFPGLSEEENCRDWDPGIPIDLNRIRDKDEAYWDSHRGTPKAFLTLAAARRLWANRFGDITAVRYSGLRADEIERGLKERMDPAGLGFILQDVRAEGLQASSSSVGFSQLFLGLSFFIVLAALLLTALVFVFNIESRAEEHGLLLALGFSRKSVTKIVRREGAVLVLVGSVLGSLPGVLYNVLVLAGLKTVWGGAVGTAALRIHPTVPSVLLGIAIGMGTAFAAIGLVTRSQVRRTISSLQTGLSRLENAPEKKPRGSFLIGVVSLFAVAAVLVLADFGRRNEAFAFFFAAGAVLLVGGLAWTNVALFHLGRKSRRLSTTLLSLGLRNAARNRTRSLTLIGLLACGLFIVFAVGANRLDALRDADRRESGTGGFAFYGESSFPVLDDLNHPKGLNRFGLSPAEVKDMSVVPFRLKEGDDASCLNLNRVSRPSLVAVVPDELSRRGAFTFAETSAEVDPRHPWAVLESELPDGQIPAVADRSVIIWGLGRAVGDSLTYQDERGATFRLKLVGGLTNSIFQGKIIVSERAFLQKFPSTSGSRIFLVDAPSAGREAVRDRLLRALQDQGLDLVPASARLAEFNAVQNTYLSIFLILGSLGMVLGSVGLVVVVWRHVQDRRGELAILRAVGFSRTSVRTMVSAEHLALVFAGLVLGLLAAGAAVLPSLRTPGADIPIGTMLIIAVAVGLNGSAWTYWAATRSTREDLLSALRKE
jgi:putative ABC transport system permease protein